MDDQPFVLVSEHAVKDKLYSALLNYKVSFMDSISYSKYLQRVQSELRQKHYQKKEHYKLLGKAFNDTTLEDLRGMKKPIVQRNGS